MITAWPILVLLGVRRLRRRHGRRQLPERLHLPDPLAEERDLAGLALPALLRVDRRPRQHPDPGLARPARRMPGLRHCRSRRVIRSIEALVGLLFAGALRRRRRLGRPAGLGSDSDLSLATLGYHALLIGLAGRRDVHRLRLFIIPDAGHGDRHGPGAGARNGRPRRSGPSRRPAATQSGTASASGFSGWPSAAGLTLGRSGSWSVLVLLRREAMGFGDVTLMAMIGAFLGWQAAVLTFFLAPVLRPGPCLVQAGPSICRNG